MSIGFTNRPVYMLKNYISIALRTVRKHKLYSFINLFGLAVGLAAFFLIGLFVQHERAFDQFHEKKERIVRVLQEQPQNTYLGKKDFAVTPVPLTNALMDELPAIESAVQITSTSALLTVGNEGFYEDGLWSTQTFFDIFTFPLLSGDPSTILSDPEHIILSESLARRLFGSTDVLGLGIEVTNYGDPETFTVVGVMEDVPSNSHIQFDFVISFLGDSEWLGQSTWGNNSYYTYALAREGTSLTQLNADVREMADRHLMELPWIIEDPEKKSNFFIQSLTDIHLYSQANFDIAENGDIRYVWLFSAIAILILLTACVNYMNLATARAATRGREVGIRKVSGANRIQLVRQFYGEAIATSLLASLGSVVIVLALLPVLNSLVDRTITTGEYLQARTLVMVLVTGCFVGLISGSYPAIFLSKMQPVSILKGGKSGPRNSFLRNTLVVGQFAIGVVLVLGAIVIQKQMAFISSADTGVNRDHVLAIRVRDMDVRRDSEAILGELDRLPGVMRVSSASHLPIRVTSNTRIRDWEGASEGAEFPLWNGSINYGLEDLAGLEIISGRAFSEERPSEAEKGILLNEAAVRAFGWTTEDAVGRTLEFRQKTEVIGVMKDFHFQTLHEFIEPLAFIYRSNLNSYLLLDISPGNVQETVSSVEAVWNQFAPNKFPFDYQFMDDAFDNQYRTELQLSSILVIFTGLAMVVACLGLFGLAAYTAEQRTKEIGIRKVLGASSPSIVLLMSREFGRLVALSFLIGLPVAYLAMERWLEAFAYRTEVGPSVFLMVGLVAMGLALMAVGFQAVRASRADPVKSLRYQ